MEPNENEMEFKSPELQRLENEMDAALVAEMQEINYELGRHRAGDSTSPNSSLDETALSLEEDLKAVENATESIQRLMNKDSEEVDTGGVQSLASMFEQHTPKTSTCLNHQKRESPRKLQFAKPSLGVTKNEKLLPGSEYAAGGNRNYSESSANDNTNVLNESSLSIKQELAMFGSPLRAKSSVTSFNKLVEHSEHAPVQKYQPPTRGDASSVKNPVMRTDMSKILAKRKALEAESKQMIKPTPVGAAATAKRGECKIDQCVFTPVKSTESLSRKWISYKANANTFVVEPEANNCKMAHSLEATNQVSTATIIDDATIKQRREALVRGLKTRLREKQEQKDEIQNHVVVDTIYFEKWSGSSADAGIETQLSTPSPLQNESSPESTSGLDTIMLHDNCVILSPINERSNEVGTPLSIHHAVSNDSDSEKWVLPMTNDFYCKGNNQSPRSRFRPFSCRCHYQIVDCMEMIWGAAKSVGKKALVLLSPCVWFVYSRLRLMILSLLTFGTNLFLLMADAWQNLRLYVVGAVEQWATISRLAPDASSAFLRGVSTMERGTAICLASLVVSMTTEVSTVAPNYNGGIAVLFWCFQAKPVESKRQSLALLCLTLLSICIDFDWLSTRYIAQPLESEDNGNTLAYRIKQEESLLQAFAWYGLLVNIVLKVIALNYSLRASHRGSIIISRIWQHINIFCSVTTPQEDVNEAIRVKVVVVLWIELFSLSVCFVSFFVIGTRGVSSALFQDGPKQMLSLQAFILYKGASGVLVFLSLLHHIRTKDLFTLCCPIRKGTVSRGRRRIASSLRNSSKCIVVTKMTDLVIGVLLFINLSQAHRDFTRDSPKESTAIFALLMFTQVITCIISPGLVAVVAWWIHSNKNKSSRERNRQGAILDNTPASQRQRRPGSRRDRRRNEPDDVPHRLPLELKSPSSNHERYSEYDLNDIGTSQNLFENRLNAASPTLESSVVTPSSQLDSDVVYSPKEFQSQWAKLTGTKIQCKVERQIPSLSECHKHFQKQRVYVIASGVVGQTTKLYLLAQKRGYQSSMSRTPPRQAAVRCLCEIAFDLQSKEMRAEIRCSDKSQTSFFVRSLGLKDLI